MLFMGPNISAILAGLCISESAAMTGIFRIRQRGRGRGGNGGGGSGGRGERVTGSRNKNAIMECG